ncbi:dsDNA nuclease domain-containing protein [Bradyrhizobium sp. ERR14]|uniref:dsDNA nuclease domain-containing protein n=1 Tax=Bradyrhizobium sp. ERR14 TaxID=2663837 RepID=UPI001621A1AD|nr:dsDNA nuclease domain-containing protein [Bradyrhizobium sp. ERR14]MBB4391662.1 hypothetical protein [Bradyrhizobium sp. ERR14]
MTGLTTTLVAAKPREKAGPRTGARYAFQLHVSLSKVLDVHASGADYRALFDHFDDLVLLNKSNSPDRIDFFQIKGKQQGSWTASGLCALSDDIPRTIIGKMYHNTRDFGSAVGACSFLTNAPFQLTLADGTKTTPDHIKITYASVGADDKKRFSAALDADFPSPRTPSEDDVLCFERTDVPVTGYDVFLKGKLVDAASTKDGLAITALYRTLIEDVTARAHDTTECTCVSDVYSRKSLGRDEIEAAFTAAEARRGILDDWAVVDDALKEAGRGTVARIKAKTAMVSYLRDRSRRAHEAVVLAADVRDALHKVKASAQQCGSLLTATELVKAALPASMLSHPIEIVEAAILLELYEALNG